MSIKHKDTETHVGQVVAAEQYTRHVHSDNAMIDSGDMLRVVVVVDGKVETHVFDNGRTDHYVRATVDAPAAALAQYAAHKAEVAAREVERHRAEAEARRIEEAKREALTVRVGKNVRVARGRKVPVGIEGYCFWLKETTYGLRAGVETPDGDVVWVYAKNLDVILPKVPAPIAVGA